METILKTGYWKVVGIFYKEPSAKFHLREIARKTKLNENSATRFLRKMEEEGILKSEREGNLLKYGIKKIRRFFCCFHYLTKKNYPACLFSEEMRSCIFTKHWRRNQ